MVSLNHYGCLLTVPGADEEPWYADGEPLFSSVEEFQPWNIEEDGGNASFVDNCNTLIKLSPDCLSAFPQPHCVTIYIPLVDINDEDGAIMFNMGSHLQTKFFLNDTVRQENILKNTIGYNLLKDHTLKVKIKYSVYLP